jgi:hypothetical protein
MNEVSVIARAPCTNVPFGRRYASGLRVARPIFGQSCLEAVGGTLLAKSLKWEGRERCGLDGRSCVGGVYVQ